MKTIPNAIKAIYNINLKLRKNEKILIFTDDKDIKLENIAQTVLKEGKKHTTQTDYLQYTATGSHGAEPPEGLWKAAFGCSAVEELKAEKLLGPLLKKALNKKQQQKTEKIIRKHKKEAVKAVIALSYYSTSHTKFRDMLTRLCGARYASMPIFDRQMFKGAMNVNWHEMAKRTNKIARMVNKRGKIEIGTPNGTFLTMSRKGRKARTDTGIIDTKGSFSNLPAGEVFLAPREGTANGKLILEWAPTRKLKKPVTLYVKNGCVYRINGKGKYTDNLRAKLAERRENRNIAELGIGTNDKASRPDNILESEKIMGTIHIALGDNSSFGGTVRTPFHQDFVFFEPTVILIDKNNKRKHLLKKGKLLCR